MNDEVMRKFDGQPMSMEPTTVLLYDNGDLGCDDVMTGAPLVFPDKDMAEAYQKLGNQKDELTATVLGARWVPKIVKATPSVKHVAFVADMGPLHSTKGKRQREMYKCDIKRDAFLSQKEGAS
jgi:hypothetical protein